MAADESQVLVKFVTRLPAELRVPETPIAVPSRLKRYGLSQIVNHLLGLDPARPFDFLVDGELLRKSLEAQLVEKGKSAETLLEIEYVPAVVPPEPKASIPHDDWVSAVAAVSDTDALAGAYDGVVRLYNADDDCTCSYTAHEGPINAVAVLPGGSAATLAVTAGKDRSLRLWQFSADKHAAERRAELVATFSGHSDCVEAVAVSPDGARMASAGWDGSLRLWRCGQEVVDAAAEAGGAKPRAPKRKKKGKDAAGDDGSAEAGGLPAGGVTEEQMTSFEGHLHCVSALAWPSHETLFSGGWDHSVRKWDAETGDNTETYSGSKAVCCVAASPRDDAVVAFGSSDRSLRLWDTRCAPGAALQVKAYASHANWVACVAWAPGSQFHIATGSKDHTLKLWDIRTAVPLATLAQHAGEVLAVAWQAGGRRLLSGGTDCALRSFELDTAPSSD